MHSILARDAAFVKVKVVGLPAEGPVEDGECCSCSLGRRHQNLKLPRRMNRNRDHRTRPRAYHNKLILPSRSAQSGVPGQGQYSQLAAIAIHAPSLQESRKVAGRRTRQDKTFTPLSCRLNLQRADLPSHRSTSQLRSRPQIASTLASDCPAGAIIARMGRIESAVGPKSYKHKDYLKLSASASPDPGAQLTFQIALADCTCITALCSPIVRTQEDDSAAD
ncbi:hypothetical protein N431DRAFT_456398 [Stipitochalara longipes BDJ]|nr:hypothetical protein N431DRAFT_456398 [Stipitochalara longipes BDJ]